MKIDIAFLHTKLARRIFWLFVACALLPIGILAGISLWNVSGELQQEGRESLHELSHQEGMSIYERLLLLESGMKGMTASLSEGAVHDQALTIRSEEMEKRFEGAAVLREGKPEEEIFGQLNARFEPNEEQKAHLASGKTVLTTKGCGTGQSCVLLAQMVDTESPGKGILVTRVRPDFLWTAEDAPEGKKICVLDERGQALFCPAETAAAMAKRTTQGITGNFEWKDFGEIQEADYWKLFLKPRYGADHWTIIASQRQADLLAPLAHFKKNFILTFLLALWIVLLLSLVQIRRNLVPLNKLGEGTRKIAAGEFSARVKIASGDEFEGLAESFNSMAERIDRQFHLLRMKSEIDRAILSSWDVEQMVNGLLDRMMRLLRYEYASVSLMDPRDGTVALTYIGSATQADDKEIRTIELAEGECRSLRENPQIKEFEGRDYPPTCVLPLTSKGMDRFMVVPIVVRGRLASILSLGSTRKETWTEEDRMLARQIADQLGVALSNANLLSDLKMLNQGTLVALARAVDAKSHWTAGHSERVTSMAMNIGREMGLPAEELQVLYRGGLLHDVGKIGVPNYVLDKPGALTESEMDLVREHVNIAGRILEPIAGFRDCMPIVLQHHEWYNGGGYPKGLAGEEISLHARIFAVADCYDALVSDRPYRPGMPLERVLGIIESERGKKYDPRVVDAFLKVVSRMQDKQTVQKQTENPITVA